MESDKACCKIHFYIFLRERGGSTHTHTLFFIIFFFCKLVRLLTIQQSAFFVACSVVCLPHSRTRQCPGDGHLTGAKGIPALSKHEELNPRYHQLFKIYRLPKPLSAGVMLNLFLSLLRLARSPSSLPAPQTVHQTTNPLS